MKILIGCEYSGRVREAFRAKGHDAWSCDLLPAEDNSEYHIQDDVLNHINDDSYDLFVGHPDCTYLCNSGVRWLYKGGNKQSGEFDKTRYTFMLHAKNFFMKLYNCNIEKVCLENPVPHGHAGLPEYSQTIQPWNFGEWESKRTCLWLKNLKPLRLKFKTKNECRLHLGIDQFSQPRTSVHLASPGPDRWKERSRTFQSIANAMAENWG